MVALFPDLIINGETVPSAQVAAEAQNHGGPKEKPGIAWRKAANAVAIRTLLQQEASARGIAATPEEVGTGRFETDEEALIRGLLDQAITINKPTEAEIRAEWAKKPEKFRAPPLWEVSHILVACDPRNEEQRQKARLRATDLAGFAIRNPTGFSALASRESDCGTKASGGSLGQLGPGDTVPEFEAALKGLNEGEITVRPVLTRHGWHVIRMDAIATGAVLPFAVVQTKVSDAMEKAAWARAARDFVQTLVATAEISGADLRSGSTCREKDELRS